MASNIKHKKSVVRFVAIVLMCGILLYSASIFLVVYSNLRKGLYDYFNKNLESQAKVFEDELGYVLAQANSTALWIQNSFSAIYPDYGFDRAAMTSFADGAVKYMGAKNIVFFNTFGMQISSPKFGVVPKTNIIREALAGKSTVKLEKTDENIYATVILPLQSEDSVFGAVEIRTPVTTQELVDKVSLYTDCKVAIFDDNRYFLSSIPNTIDTEVTNQKLIEDAAEGSPTVLMEEYNGEQYISYYFPFFDDDGNYLTTLLIAKKLDIVVSVTNEIFSPLIGVIVVFTIALLFGIVMIIHVKMTKPLRNVNKALADLSSGDANLTARLYDEGHDEYSALSSDVNKFIEMLQKIVIELNVAQNSLENASNNLKNNADNSASAAEEILSHIENVRGRLRSQTDAVNDTTEVLDHTSSAMENLMNLIEKQAEGISDSSAAIEQMLSNISSVNNSVKKMSSSFDSLSLSVDAGKNKLRDMCEKVNEISQQSQMLLQANAIIAQIASETNLLSMNAAIEASHAGDSGKGFSVVAEEIRKLAENSSVQSKNITAELKTITDSIENVVHLSNESQISFSEIVTQLSTTSVIIKEIDNSMNEQAESSRLIFDSLGNMKNHSMEVEKKSDEMNKGLLKVTGNMSSVSQMSNAILGSMDEMTGGMKQIDCATRNVSDLATQTKSNVEMMKGKLNQFKV